MIALAMRSQEAEALLIARDVTAPGDALSNWIIALTAVVAVVATFVVIWRALCGAPVIVAGPHDGRCLEEGCGLALVAVHATRGRVLYCPAGHCWVERVRKLGVDVFRYRSSDCPYPHPHHAGCAQELTASHG